MAHTHGTEAEAGKIGSLHLRFEALQYKSTINNIDQISTILRKQSLRISPDLVIRVPTPDERSCHAPEGSNKLQFSA